MAKNALVCCRLGQKEKSTEIQCFVKRSSPTCMEEQHLTKPKKFLPGRLQRKLHFVCHRFPSAKKKIEVFIFPTCPFSFKIFRGSLGALSFSVLASTMAAMGVFCQMGELKSTVGFPFGEEGSFSAQTVLSL